MSKTWKIDKQFNFCYGHRVWSQKLEAEYCEKKDVSCKCRFLHGHEGLVHVFLESECLERGMVTDFKHLGWLKDFLDDTIDHKFILDMNDPYFGQIINGKIGGQIRHYQGIPTGGLSTVERLVLPSTNGVVKQLPLLPITVPGVDYILGYKVDVYASTTVKGDTFLEGPEKEFYEGFVIVDFIPTSENLCEWLYDVASSKMSRLGIKVSQVDWHETAKSRSSIFAS